MRRHRRSFFFLFFLSIQKTMQTFLDKWPSELCTLVEDYYGLPDCVIIQWIDRGRYGPGPWGGSVICFMTKRPCEEFWQGPWPEDDKHCINVWVLSNNILNSHHEGWGLKRKTILVVTQDLSGIVQSAWDRIKVDNQWYANCEVLLQLTGSTPVLGGIQLFSHHEPFPVGWSIITSDNLWNRWVDPDALAHCSRGKKRKAI